MTLTTSPNAIFSFALIVLLGACGKGSSDPEPAEVLPQYDLGLPDLEGDVAISGEVSRYLSVATAKSNGLATSPVCAECHGNSDASSAMKDAAGRKIAPFDLWQSSMKANAA